MKLLIIDNFDSFTFNLIQLVEQAGITDFTLVKNDQLLQLNEQAFTHIIISPGPGLASEAGELLPFLKKVIATKPVLGICLGYEALAELAGARLRQLDQPLHGIRNIGHIIAPHPILNQLPELFHIGHYHSWIADETTFSADIRILMRDESGLNMAIAHRVQPWVGLLFHPESIMTEYGLDMIKNWLNL